MWGKKGQSGDKKAESGTESGNELTADDICIDPRYICPPGTCMKQPSRCSVYISRNYQKVKYIIAAVLLVALVLTLIIYAATCSNKNKKHDKEEKRQLDNEIRVMYYGSEDASF